MAWNAEYQSIIMLDMSRRAETRDLIDALDQRGLELADLVAIELAPAKIDYYSEGLLSRISDPIESHLPKPLKDV